MGESEFNCTITDKCGRNIDLVLDEDQMILHAIHNGKPIGRMEFLAIENDRSHDDLKLIWMYLDLAGSEYTGVGIGREMIKLMNEYNCGPLVAEPVGGSRQEDGSHLTGNAPGFIQKMRDDGLIR